MEFTVIRRLDEWTAGEILLARLPGGTFCEVRRTHPGDNERELGVLLKSWQTACGLPLHPNLVRALGAGIDGQVAWVATEAVIGATAEEMLSAIKRNGKPSLPIGPAMRILRDAISGVDAAHGRRGPTGSPDPSVHAFLSPRHLRVDFQGEAKVGGFVIEKAAQRYVGAIRGLVRYFSPEQAEGLVIDSRSDLFTLGTVLFELLTGASPLRTESTAGMGMLDAILREDPPLPSSLSPGCPEVVDRLLMKALSKNPDHRFQTGAEFVEAIDEALDAAVIPATREDVAELVRGLCADHPPGRV